MVDEGEASRKQNRRRRGAVEMLLADAVARPSSPKRIHRSKGQVVFDGFPETCGRESVTEKDKQTVEDLEFEQIWKGSKEEVMSSEVDEDIVRARNEKKLKKKRKARTCPVDEKGLPIMPPSWKLIYSNPEYPPKVSECSFESAWPGIFWDTDPPSSSDSECSSFSLFP